MSFAKKDQDPVLSQKLFCHSFNSDRSLVAVCPYTASIIIYETNGSDDFTKWKQKYELKEHDHLVTAIDWAPETNRILSCSQDRNAYVWAYDKEKDEWKQTLVLLRINRAATCCQWSQKENKFAVGSGTKVLSVCYFENDNNWWVSKMIKKHKSTVLSVGWHPTDNTIVATGSSDFKCRVFSAWIKSLDNKEDKKGGCGKLLHEYKASGWVHDVKFSPSGKWLAYASHDSVLHVVEFGTDKEPQDISYPTLPLTNIIFLNDDTIVGAGHEFSPTVFKCSEGAWSYTGRSDHGQYKKTESNRKQVRSAFLKFQNADSVGSESGAKSSIKTRHKNAVLGMEIVEANDGEVSKFSTLGVDGRLFLWDAKKAVSDVKA